MKLDELFEQLLDDEQGSGAPGTVYRRLPTSSPCNLFVGVEKPGNSRTFRARFSRQFVELPAETIRLRGVEMVTSEVTENGCDYISVVIKLLQPAFADLFTNVAEDIERHVSVMRDERAAATAFVDRMKKWRQFLESHAPDGLNAEEQRGLYGELRFFGEFFLGRAPALQAVTSWTGPGSTAKDFQLSSGIACEIKTTSSIAPLGIKINGETQLDDFGLLALFLACLFVDETRGAGTSLPDIIDQIRKLLSVDYEATLLFEDKLHQAGYLDIHRNRYTSVGYLAREERYFRVTDGFPRLTKSNIPPGVGRVHYTISIDACAEFIVERDILSASLESVP